MSKNAILAYSGCFLGRLRLCLTEAKDAKSAKGASAWGASVGDTSAGGASVGGTSAGSASVQGACVCAELFGTSEWSSIDVLSIS